MGADSGASDENALWNLCAVMVSFSERETPFLISFLAEFAANAGDTGADPPVRYPC
jgi:hypothetical protein